MIMVVKEKENLRSQKEVRPRTAGMGGELRTRVGSGFRLPKLLTDGIDLQGSKYQKVCLLLPQFILEHCCHLIALEDLVGRLILNIKYHLGAAKTCDNMNEQK